MNNDCSTCKHYLGGGYCRLNEEAECRDGGGYELWDDGVAAHEDELPEEPPRCVLEELMDARRPDRAETALKWMSIALVAAAWPVLVYKIVMMAL